MKTTREAEREAAEDQEAISAAVGDAYRKGARDATKACAELIDTLEGQARINERAASDSHDFALAHRYEGAAKAYRHAAELVRQAREGR